MLQRGLFERARLRLAGWYVVFLGVILLALDFGVFTIMGSALESRVDDDLQHKAQQASTAIVFSGGSSSIDRSELAGDPSWSDVSLYVTTATGTVLASAAPFASPILPDRRALESGLAGHSGFSQLTRAGEPFIVYTMPANRPAPGGSRVAAVVQVARSARTLVDASTSLVTLLLGATVFALALAFVAGMWLADKAVAPIRAGLARQKDFVTDASHELRTPIAVIRTAAESILRQKDKRPARVEELAQDIIAETEQLARMVADLGDLARADSRMSLHREPVEVVPLLEETAAAGRLLAQSRGVELEAHLGAGGTLRADEVRLRQLFTILLDNATRFSPPGKPVSLTAAQHNGRLQVSVRDLGPGIPEEELPRVFDRFYRGADQRHQEGSGLGLSIAHWIVEEHEGEISVRSEVGVGTEFTVELPLA